MALLARVPDLDRARARRLRAPLGAAAAVGLATLALHLRDPHQHGSWGLCPFKAITGLDCPGCGGLRAVNDLGQGRFHDAAHSNVLFVASIPLLVGIWALWLRRRWTGDSTTTFSAAATRRFLTVYGALVVVFTVYRNTPSGRAWFV